MAVFSFFRPGRGPKCNFSAFREINTKYTNTTVSAVIPSVLKG